MNQVLFSKKSDDWATPKEIYNYFINKKGITWLFIEVIYECS